MLDKSISGLKQGFKCIHFLVHVVVVMVPLVLGVLISLALRHTGAAFTPCPYSVTGVAVGYIEDGY